MCLNDDSPNGGHTHSTYISRFARCLQKTMLCYRTHFPRGEFMEKFSVGKIVKLHATRAVTKRTLYRSAVAIITLYGCAECELNANLKNRKICSSEGEIGRYGIEEKPQVLLVLVLHMPNIDRIPRNLFFFFVPAISLDFSLLYPPLCSRRLTSLTYTSSYISCCILRNVSRFMGPKIACTVQHDAAWIIYFALPINSWYPLDYHSHI